MADVMFTPGKVGIGSAVAPGQPYLPSKPITDPVKWGRPQPFHPKQVPSQTNWREGNSPKMMFGNPTASMTAPQPANNPSGPNVVGAESVRATGSGPFDAAYRQNLATFAGGLFQRPGGNLSFNPTSNQAFGQTVGGGNAPSIGMPNTLAQQAIGGNPFSYNPPTPKQQAQIPQLSEWMDQLMSGNFSNKQRSQL